MDKTERNGKELMSERARLIGRKYGQGISQEEEKRLEFLDAEASRLFPRVTADQKAELAQIIKSLEQPDGTAHGFHLSLGYNTVVSVNTIGDMRDMPHGGGQASVDYEFVERGRLSNLGIKKRLQRFFLNALAIAVYDHPDAPAGDRHRAVRARNWNRRNVECYRKG